MSAIKPVLLLRVVHTVTITGLVMFMIAVMSILGPQMEGKYFPVVENATFQEVTDDIPGQITLQVNGVKMRSCRFLQVNTLVNVDGAWVQGEVDFAASTLPKRFNGPGISRPTGKQSFGIWVIKPKGKNILFEVRHNCHPFWDTVTPLGIWP